MTNKEENTVKNTVKKHTSASLNLYFVAGLYLLYIDYFLVSKWGKIDSDKKFIVGVAILVFGLFALYIVGYAIRGHVDMKKVNEEETKQIDQENTKEL